MTDKPSKQFQQTKVTLETKEFDIPQLRNFYDNISKFPEIPEHEREQLIHIVSNLIQRKLPQKTKKIVEGKSLEATTLLEEVLSQLKKEFDWVKNEVGSYVKVGGDMVGARAYVYWYISYKNIKGVSTSFAYRQIEKSDKPFISVILRQVGNINLNEEDVKNFPLEQKEKALELYKSHLKNIII